MRTLTVTYEGRTYSIPELWLMGRVAARLAAGQSHGLIDAVDDWHRQELAAGRAA